MLNNRSGCDQLERLCLQIPTIQVNKSMIMKSKEKLIKLRSSIKVISETTKYQAVFQEVVKQSALPWGNTELRQLIDLDIQHRSDGDSF
ncbi:MAG: hypothetical protein A2X58_03305 [Nitrospirae bacterium GWC2_56_14]|nr:MAG: hypothetical protein A2X58_03305 [Nitrospirae bacterium GWC2_56_14]